MMKLTTKDCKQYIVDWYANNRDALSVVHTEERYGSWVGDGLDPKDWSRCAKSSFNGKTYRAFQPGCTILDHTIVIVLTEDNGVIVKLEHGKRAQFEGVGNYFKEIKWNGI